MDRQSREKSVVSTVEEDNENDNDNDNDNDDGNGNGNKRIKIEDDSDGNSDEGTVVPENPSRDELVEDLLSDEDTKMEDV